MKSTHYIIGIDGGGTKTHGVLFNSEGKTICESNTKGSNLDTYENKGSLRILDLLKNLCDKSKIEFANLSAVGIGVAGISNKYQRDNLLNEIDKFNLSKKSLVLSDAESAYKLLCPNGVGVLVLIGTGIICIGRKNGHNTLKVAGKGNENGDVGSGYWIGKRIIKSLILKQNIINIDKEITELNKMVLKKLNIENLSLLDKIDNPILKIASIAEDVIEFASRGNDLALSVIQEGTTYVADYITFIYNELRLNKNNVIIAAHGSIISNKFYRRVLHEALQFEFSNIHWVFTNLSSAYGAGLIAAQYKNIDISLNKIKNWNEK